MMDAGGGGVRSQGVNPDCPSAANPFHRCADYCPVPAPAANKAASAAAAAARGKPAPPRPRTTMVAQNGTAKHGDGAARVVPAADAEEEEEGGGEREESRAVNPGYLASKTSPPRQGPAPVLGYAAQNGTARRNDEGECEITVVDDSEERGESVEDYGAEEVSGGRTRTSARSPATDGEVGGGRTRTSARSPATDGEAGGERQWQAVNSDCPNAANPFHRCAEYCPVPVPKVPPPPPPRGYEGSTHSDPGALNPRPRRRDKGGSGGLPLYVFLREGSDGDGKKVDPRCPNAPNPFHVCTDHCLAKIADAGRSSEGARSPISLFSRHSRRSSSSSEDGSLKSPGSRKVDPKCPNAGNPFHECGEHCATKMQQAEQHKGVNIKSPRRKGGKNAAVIPNWKVDPRCPNASNPFHVCAQYCFDHLSETAQTSATKSDKRRGKDVSKDEQRGEINPDCVNTSNPYHKCGDHCKRKG
ncbi:uncharacterized protein [Miscanthus floridulus]|uniref:uncharacterized protein n=1 Tax=Miscanthus floridulus TaxID=154761 RepID=UPI003458BD53